MTRHCGQRNDRTLRLSAIRGVWGGYVDPAITGRPGGRWRPAGCGGGKADEFWDWLGSLTYEEAREIVYG